MDFVGAVDYVRQWHKEVGDKLNDDKGLTLTVGSILIGIFF